MSKCGKCDGSGEIRSVEYNPRWVRYDTCQGTGDVDAANYQKLIRELQQRIATLETAAHAEANEAALMKFAARCERLDGSLSRVRLELDTARETNRRLNERCQTYEKAIAEKVKEHPGPSFGRALANAEAERLSGLLEATQAERDAAVAERDRLRETLQRIEMLERDFRADPIGNAGVEHDKAVIARTALATKSEQEPSDGQ